MATRGLAWLVLLTSSLALGAESSVRGPPLQAPVERGAGATPDTALLPPPAPRAAPLDAPLRASVAQDAAALDAPLSPEGPPTLFELSYSGKGHWDVALFDDVPGEIGPPLVSLDTVSAAPEYPFRYTLHPVAPLARIELH